MFAEVAPFSTRTIRLLEGDLFAFTADADGRWVDWPNLYCVAQLRPTGIGLATMTAKMNAVCQLHNWCASCGIDLRARVESLDLFSMEEIAGLRKELRVNLLTRPKKRIKGGARKAKRGVVGNSQWRSRCADVRDYVVWHADHAIQRMSSRDERLQEASKRLKEFRARIMAKIRVHRKGPKEGLEKAGQAALLDALTPGHPTNPFAERHQVRNQALWLSYFDGGIRLGEALVVKCADLHLHGANPKLNVYRSPDDPDDPRAVEPRTKTLPHPVPLTNRCARALHTYVTQHRPRQRGAKRSAYVFFSQQGKPLSVSSVAYMYRRLRAKVPSLPADFSTHILRYTWNDRFGDAAEGAGISDDQERSIRNLHQGWTPHSAQGQQYQSRRLRRRAGEISLRMQDRATGGPAE